MRQPTVFLLGFSLAACGTMSTMNEHEDALSFAHGGLVVTAQCVPGLTMAVNGCETLADLEAAAAAACGNMNMVLAQAAASGICTTASGAAGHEQIEYACCPAVSSTPNGGANGGNANPAPAPAPAPTQPNTCIVDSLILTNQCEDIALMKTKAENICLSHQMQLSNIVFDTCANTNTARAMKFACCPAQAPAPTPTPPPAPTPPTQPQACQDITVGLPPVNMQSTNPQVLSGQCAEISDIKMQAFQRCQTLGLPNLAAFTPTQSSVCQDPLASGAQATCCH